MDSIIVTSDDNEERERLKGMLVKEFEIIDLGK